MMVMFDGIWWVELEAKLSFKTLVEGPRGS